MAGRPANDEMVQGYLDGLDLSSPEPSENRSHSYRHGFAAGRSDKGVKSPWGNYAEAIMMADEAMARDDDAMTPARPNSRRRETMAEEPRTALSDGTQVYPAHREIVPETGQQRGYVVLAEEERAKGFVRPVRRSYRHLKCGIVTTMGQTLAETYARDPYFYSGTFCCGCGSHFQVGADGEFVWDGRERA